MNFSIIKRFYNIFFSFLPKLNIACCVIPLVIFTLTSCASINKNLANEYQRKGYIPSHNFENYLKSMAETRERTVMRINKKNIKSIAGNIKVSSLTKSNILVMNLLGFVDKTLYKIKITINSWKVLSVELIPPHNKKRVKVNSNDYNYRYNHITDFLTIYGQISKDYHIDFHFNVRDIISRGFLRVKVKGNSAYLNGILGTLSYQKIKDTLDKNPKINTLVFGKVPGTVDSLVNFHIGRLIRQRGLNTRLTASSKIASGGTSLFLAGKKRIVHPSAKIGVHSWCCAYIGSPHAPFVANKKNNVSPTTLLKDHPAHEPKITYYNEMLGSDIGKEFYFYTIRVASPSQMHYMSLKEIKKYKIATSIR